MRKLFLRICTLIVSLTFFGCASIPSQSITLSEAITVEGKRMHQLNLVLLNKMFNAKREKIDTFIKNEYTPKYLDEFKKRAPEGIDFEVELPNILAAVIPEINSRRDIMQSVLEDQRVKLVTKIKVDYKSYEEASLKRKRSINPTCFNMAKHEIFGVVL